jgi:hypothetical protein
MFDRRAVSSVFAIAIAAAWSGNGRCGEVERQGELRRLVEVMVDAARAEASTPSWRTFLARAYGAKALVPHLATFFSHTSPKVRQDMYGLVGWLGANTSRPSVRRDAVDRLAGVLKREGTGRRSPAGVVTWALLRFSPGDFSDRAKEHIAEFLRVPSESRELTSKIIRIVGLADIRSQIPTLKGLLSDEIRYRSRSSTPGPASWEARKALARMGSVEDIERCIEIVESATDPRMRVAIGLGDLSYIRRREIVEYLLKYLHDDTEFTPIGSEEAVRYGSLTYTYAHFAASALHEMIRDFPLQKRPGFCTQEDIRTCREWMAAHRDYELRMESHSPDEAPLADDAQPVTELSKVQRAVLDRLLAAYADRWGGYERRISGLWDIMSHAFGAEILPPALPHLSDPSAIVRILAVHLVGAAAADLEDQKARRDAIEQLVLSLDDSEAGRSASERACEYLNDTTSADFTDKARDALVRLVTRERPLERTLFAKLVLVAGIADIPSLLPRLKAILDAEKEPQGSRNWWRSAGWAAMRARARMGVEADIARCIEIVEAEPEVKRRLPMYFGHLSYVRRREVVDYFRKYLDSNETIYRRSGAYAGFAAYQLSRMLQGFPVKKLGPGNYSAQNILDCRQWQVAYDLVR